MCPPTPHHRARLAAEDAIDEEQFDRLYAAACDTDHDRRRIENRFIVIGAGRLTFRSGALLHSEHMRVDRDRKIIKIPSLAPCRCNYCQERAKQLAADHDDLSYEEALDVYWQPKTDASVRAIYYGFSERAIDTVETFFDEVGELDMVQSTINRRIDRLAERAQIRGNLYPHALRASAGFFWAEKGLEAHYLQALMGWKDLRVARSYIRATGRQLARRIQSITDTLDEPAEPTTSLPDPVDAVKEVTGEHGYETAVKADKAQQSLTSFAEG